MLDTKIILHKVHVIAKQGYFKLILVLNISVNFFLSLSCFFMLMGLQILWVLIFVKLFCLLCSLFRMFEVLRTSQHFCMPIYCIILGLSFFFNVPQSTTAVLIDN